MITLPALFLSTLVLSSLALAGSDTTRLTVLADDRDAKRLQAAQVVVEQEETVAAPLLDDGSCPNDLPGDGIWCAQLNVRKAETLSLGVLEGDQRLGTVSVFLPNADQAQVALRTRSSQPALVLDMTAETPAYAGTADQAPKASDAILLQISLDDSSARHLAAPLLSLKDRDVAPVQALDDGSLWKDVAGDGIYRADLSFERSAEVTLLVEDQGQALGSFDLQLPFSNRAELLLRYRGDPPQLLLIDESQESADDQILLHLRIDDSEVQRLQAPVVHAEQDGVEPARASDDGSVLGDQAGDGIHSALLLLRREPFLALRLRDGETDLGSLEIPLPASNAATITIATQEGSPALQLKSALAGMIESGGETEGAAGGASPTPTPGSAAPGAHTAPAGSAASGAGSTLVLWLNLGLFLLLFAYLRVSLRRTVRDELRPLQERLTQWIERHGP